MHAVKSFSKSMNSKGSDIVVRAHSGIQCHRKHRSSSLDRKVF